MPVADRVLRPGTLAVDLMYGPAARPFMAWAERHGAVPRDGLGMLVEQAAEAFFLWRQVMPDTAPVLQRLRRHLDAPHRADEGGAPGCWRWCCCACWRCSSSFALRIGAMAFVDPQSTSFQRSEAWRLLTQRQQILWSQQWVPYDADQPAPEARRHRQRGRRLRRAQRRRVGRDRAGLGEEPARRGAGREARQARDAEPAGARAKVVGGSTITQQLAKNLFLSGERTVLRKAQEFVLTLMLEGLLSKQRILEIYLNNVEWGEGVFGAQAAARHYFRKDAARLGARRGGAAGGDAAGAQALREAPRLGLCQRARRHHRRPHGRGGIALSQRDPRPRMSR